MPKKKTSKKREFCFEHMPNLGANKKYKGTKVQSSKAFKNKKEVALALFLCLERDDPEVFIEILDTYLDVNKAEIAKKAWIARSTVQGAFSNKGNPTIRTIDHAACIKSLNLLDTKFDPFENVCYKWLMSLWKAESHFFSSISH